MASPLRFLSRLAIGVLLFAWSIPYLHGRQAVLSLLVKNRPDNLREINTFPNYSIKLTNRVRNCEDALLVEEDGFAILSCDPGRDHWNTVMGTFYPDRSLIPNGNLWIYRYDLPDDSKESLVPIELADYPGEFSFHPVGVEYHRDTSTLFVCNHHLEGSRVDTFTLDIESTGTGVVARHKKTILHPRIRTPNSIAALNENEFYVSNDHYIRQKDYPVLALVETYAGIPGGSVAYVNLASETVHTVARIPFANGVTLINHTTVAVAATSSAEVRFYTRGDDNSLQYSSAIKVPFLPDNLSTDEDGNLLIAGHPHPPSLDKVVHARTECIGVGGVVPSECWQAEAPSYVARWTATKGVEELYVSTTEFGTGSTAIRDGRRKVGIITGLYENGVLVWRE